MIKLRLERGQAATIAAAANSTAKIWSEPGKAQKSLYDSLAAGESVVVGPFMNITEFEIEDQGSVTVTPVSTDFSTPVSIFDFAPALTKAASIDDATDEVDVVERFNELLVALRAAGLMEEAE